MDASRSRVADLNLLFGILALQMDFVTRDQLISAMNAWVLDKSKPIADLLVAQRALGPARHMLLDALVQEHLKQHEDDPQQSLATLSSLASIRKDLEQIADADLQGSLAQLPPSPHRGRGAGGEGDDDPAATISVGASTSTGQRFRIVRPHAEGGLGKVSVAHDGELNREVALKEIKDQRANDGESRARFLLEAEITGGLEHPGIVPVYGLGTYADGRPFYAMRFIKGDSLKEAIGKYHLRPESGTPEFLGNRALDLRKLLGRLIDVCQAMQYAHDRGVLHRDLKPGNIMLGKYGETLVVDWGLAKAVGKNDAVSEEATLRPSSASSSAETLPGSAIGTPAYMSPEQAAGRLDLLGPASDVYSLGATLYSLLTGKPSIEDKDVIIALRKVREGTFVRPREHKSGVDPALEAICLKAMKLQPGDRYASPRALAEDLERWLADQPVTAWPEPWTVKVRRGLNRHRTLVTATAAATLVALLGAGGAGAWYVREQAAQAIDASHRETEVTRALDEADRLRYETREQLRDPLKTARMLSDIQQWHATLQLAQAAWSRADKLAERHDLPLDLRARLDRRREELQADMEDWKVNKQLDDVRMRVGMAIEGDWDFHAADPLYEQFFDGLGFKFRNETPTQLAKRIRASANRYVLVTALDHWAYLSRDRDLIPKLLETARLADPEPWRDQFRNLATWENAAELERLANKIDVAAQPPNVLLALAFRLDQVKKDGSPLLYAALVHHPRDFWLYLTLGDRLKNIDASIGCFQAATALRPDSPIAYHNLGHAQLRKPALDDAYRNFHRALELDPKMVRAITGIGTAHLKKKEWTDAVRYYEQAMAVPATTKAGQADYLVAKCRLGLCLLQSGKAAPALEHLREVERTNPDFPPLQAALGAAMTLTNDISQAIVHLNQAIKLDPKSSPAYNNLGTIYARKGDYKKSQAFYLKSLEYDDTDPVTYYNLGKIAFELKDSPTAIAYFEKALDRNPVDSEALNNLGLVYFSKNELKTAIIHFQKALKIDPKNAYAHGNMGWAHMRQGNLIEAGKSFQRYYEAMPGAALPTQPKFDSNR